MPLSTALLTSHSRVLDPYDDTDPGAKRKLLTGADASPTKQVKYGAPLPVTRRQKATNPNASGVVPFLQWQPKNRVATNTTTRANCMLVWSVGAHPHQRHGGVANQPQRITDVVQHNPTHPFKSVVENQLERTHSMQVAGRTITTLTPPMFDQKAIEEASTPPLRIPRGIVSNWGVGYGIRTLPNPQHNPPPAVNTKNIKNTAYLQRELLAIPLYIDTLRTCFTTDIGTPHGETTVVESLRQWVEYVVGEYNLEEDDTKHGFWRTVSDRQHKLNVPQKRRQVPIGASQRTANKRKDEWLPRVKGTPY